MIDLKVHVSALNRTTNKREMHIIQRTAKPGMNIEEDALGFAKKIMPGHSHMAHSVDGIYITEMPGTVATTLIMLALCAVVIAAILAIGNVDVARLVCGK